MDHEKAERLRIMLEEALKPVMDRLDKLEQDIQELKNKREDS